MSAPQQHLEKDKAMKNSGAFFLIAIGGLAFTACTETDGTGSASIGTPTQAQQSCLAAVSNETNNGDVSVISSEFSQAGTQVTIGVGPQRAPWSCIAYSDGSTAGIQSLTNEGTL